MRYIYLFLLVSTTCFSQTLDVTYYPPGVLFQFEWLYDMTIDDEGVIYAVTNRGELSIFRNGS